jgi:radical SAM protein (TIGR04043 family)
LQSQGLRLHDPSVGAPSRRGGAGPSDHKAVTIDGHTIMVPVHTSTAWVSPFVVDAPDALGISQLKRGSIPIATIQFPKQPRFYALQTLDGIAYSQIATLHSADVLATTILQTCIRYESRRKACKFCAIGQSLAAGRTIAHKTPQQLAEVARAAVLLDGVKHMVMTTGTPPGDDRGAQVLCKVNANLQRTTAGLRACVPPASIRWACIWRP